MKLYQNTNLIGIDHGYGSIKTASTVTPSGIIRANHRPYFGEVLEYNGRYYTVGENHKAFVSDKTSDEDYYLLTLIAIAKELRRQNIFEADVHLSVALPLNWVQKQRSAFRNYLLRQEEVEYVFDKKRFNIHFAGCDIFPQTYPAVLTKLNDLSGVTMVADIGNGTINILMMQDQKVIGSQCRTEKLGVNQCIIEAQNAVFNQFGTKVDDFIIEQVFRGTAYITEDIIECIENTIHRYNGKVMELLKKYEYNEDTMILVLCGGGASLFKQFESYDEELVEIIDDVCACAKGLETLSYSKLAKKDAGK